MLADVLIKISLKQSYITHIGETSKKPTSIQLTTKNSRSVSIIPWYGLIHAIQSALSLCKCLSSW